MPAFAAVTRDHIVAALAQLKEGAPHLFGASREYDLLWEGHRYPPKAVLGLAYGVATGQPLGPKDFSGGEGAGQANTVLRDLGFDIVEKDWSSGENKAVVSAYFELYAQILSGSVVTKTQAHRWLQALLNGRTEQSIKRKFENISSYLADIGLRPMGGYSASSDRRQRSLEPHIQSYLEKHPSFRHRIRADAEDPEGLVQEGATAAEKRARRRGQGYGLTLGERKAVEAHAMEQAKAYFQKLGYRVVDCSAKESFDLLCRRPGASPLRVEVKGTTTRGETVILTKNEVILAQEESGSAVLFLVHSVRLASEDGKPKASGGARRVISEWCPRQEHLTALSFSYMVPEVGTADEPVDVG